MRGEDNEQNQPPLGIQNKELGKQDHLDIPEMGSSYYGS